MAPLIATTKFNINPELKEYQEPNIFLQEEKE